MKKLTVAMTAVGLLLGGTSSASAAVSVIGVESWNLDGPLQFGQSYIQDYDNPLAAGFAYVGDNPYSLAANTYVRSGGLLAGESAPPPVLGPGNTIVYESTEYQTVENGGLASIEALGGKYFTTFSLYMGSPDSYNHISFRLFNGNTLLDTLSGEAIWGGQDPNEDNGAQNWGNRIYYGFGNSQVTKIEFTSTGNSFEFDGLAATTAVPEPGTWTLMILGFGSAGALLRSQRRRVVAA
jgi:hypothetical protein